MNNTHGGEMAGKGGVSQLTQEIARSGLQITHLTTFLQKNEGVRLALTEAVHRFYNDYCFSPYTERPYEGEAYETISHLHDCLTAENPDWRSRLKHIADRYADAGKATQAFVGSKPKHAVELFTINIVY